MLFLLAFLSIVMFITAGRLSANNMPLAFVCTVLGSYFMAPLVGVASGCS